MKRLILLSGIALCLMYSGSQLYAQQVRNAVVPAKGQFAVTAQTEKVQVNYRITPAYPDNVVLQIQPSAPFTLNARITDSKGKEVIKIKNEDVTLRWAESIDISNLSPGNYFIEIVTGTGKSDQYKIAFTK